LTVLPPNRTIQSVAPRSRRLPPLGRAFALGFAAALGAALALFLFGILIELVFRPWG
jgi:hypothetical protein